ncbi:MAG: response regulator [Oligoflexia bacterium]|nr:response regulator [Oligoflexia bacterium]
MNGTRKILLVEDNLADAYLTKHVLNSGTVECDIQVVHDGEAAINYLLNRENGIQIPDLVILDLNLPKKDGREVLKEIKNHPKLRRIPVLVYSTSSAVIDISQCYDLHANCYYKKPFHLDDLILILRSVEQDWLKFAQLPTKDALEVHTTVS